MLLPLRHHHRRHFGVAHEVVEGRQRLGERGLDRVELRLNPRRQVGAQLFLRAWS
jgi:hypothetical protein